MTVVICSQTYCVDRQVAESACTATAYLTGVKGNYETIGVSAAVKQNDCVGSLAPQNRTDSIAQWAIAAGKAAGLVTTTKVTHASPAGTYAHTSNRNWESDKELNEAAANASDVNRCEDIAKQLMTGHPGKDFKASSTCYRRAPSSRQNANVVHGRGGRSISL